MAFPRSCFRLANPRRPGSRRILREQLRLFSSSPPKQHATLGFVGLGNMGLPMATNLAKNWSVIAYDPNETARRSAQEAGMELAKSVDQVGSSGCSVVFTMLPGCAAVDAVTPILFQAATTSTVFVDCSTVSETLKDAVFNIFVLTGVSFIPFLCRFIPPPVVGGMTNWLKMAMHELMPPFLEGSR